MEKAQKQIINTSIAITGIILDKERKDYMAYRLNKKGKAVVIALLFALAYVLTGMLIDSFLLEQEQLRVKSIQLKEQIEDSKN